MDPLNTAITEVWENHPDELYRQDQSHYRGVGRWADDEQWLGIGQSTLKKVRDLWHVLGRSPERLADKVILEWGPGGGANAYGLKSICSRYHGIDISGKNLAEACRVLAFESKSSYFHPLLLGDAPASIAASIPKEIDIFLSTAVFQHFPSRDYGCEVLHAIRSVCRDDAAGFIQIRFDNGREKYRGIQNLEEYQMKHIFANSYPIDEFWDHCVKAGFRPLYVGGIRSANNYATFLLSAR